VRSRRGPHGGYVLGRSAEQMTIRDLIEAVEGPITLNVFVGAHPDSFLLGACGMNRVWAEGQRRVMDLFENTTIASVSHAQSPARAEPGLSEFPSQGAV
jgi:DNA-binding IscR family transcriptional regulator